MSNLVDLNPYGVYNDLQGRPLNNGKIYIGLPNQDPKQYPAQVFWDAALTIPAAQPLRTVGGYVARNGSPAKIYINGNYSLKVVDKNDLQIFYVPDYYLVGSAAVATIGILEGGYTASLPDYAALRNFTAGNNSVYINGYNASSSPSGISGQFTYDPTDTTSADNGGTIIVSTNGKRWKRQYETDVNVTWFGATAGVSTDQSPAFLSALSIGEVVVPKGVWSVDLTILKNGLAGYKMRGESATETILKAVSGATHVLRITGSSSSYCKYSSFSNFTIDMTGIADIAGNAGLKTDQTFGNKFENINIINFGANNYTYYAQTGTYTTTFSNCDLGGVSGKVKLQGTSLSDAVTTITFTDNTSFGSLIADQASTINCFGVVVQGSLDKFVLSNVNGVNVFGGDFEGPGVFLNLGAGVDNLNVCAPTLNGFSGTFMTGTFNGGAVMAVFGGEPFYFSPISGVAVSGTVKEENKSAGLTRKVIKNSSATASVVDVQTQNSTGSHFIGLDASGNSYLDNRASGKIALQVSGNDKLGVTASNKLLVGTLVSASANIGANGATPAQVAGYLVMEISGITYKVPYYNN